MRRVFGPSKEEIWTQIANEIGGEYIDRGFWESDALAFQHKEWTIVLDTFSRSAGQYGSTTYTHMRAPFVNKDGLYFKIYRETGFSAIGKLFGMQDIEVGDRFFDYEFIIKDNSEEKIKMLLKSDQLKSLIKSIPSMQFQVKDGDERLFSRSFPQGVDMLYFESTGVIKDTTTLRNLFLLFSAVLERLVQIDSAYEDDAMVNLD